MGRRVLLVVVSSLLVVTLLAACGDDEISLDPPEIRYGEDISEMGMFVIDPRYTVATLPADSEEWLLFDDIGELFKYRDAYAEAEFQVMWVNDYHAEEWLHAEDATYLETPELNSPMGWGVAAFEDEADATAMQEETGGEILTWEEVEARTWTAPPAPMHLDANDAASPMPVASPEEHSAH